MKDTAFHVPEKKRDRIAEAFDIDPDTKAGKASEPAPSRHVRPGGGGPFHRDGLRALLRHAGRRRRSARNISGRKTLEFMASDHLGRACEARVGPFCRPATAGFRPPAAVRTTPGMTVVPGPQGSITGGASPGTTFWIDPKEDLFAMLMIQAPGQRDYYRMLFRTLVYAAVE